MALALQDTYGPKKVSERTLPTGRGLELGGVGMAVKDLGITHDLI